MGQAKETAAKGGKGLVEKVTDAVKAAAAAAAGITDGLVSGDPATADAPSDVDHHAQVAAEDAADDYGRAKLAQVDCFSQLPENVSLQLRFADGTTFVDGAIDVDRGDFAGAGFVGHEHEQSTYQKPVEFDLHGPIAHVTEAWLIAASGDAVRCAVGTAPLVIGGGNAARIPSGYLLF